MQLLYLAHSRYIDLSPDASHLFKEEWPRLSCKKHVNKRGRVSRPEINDSVVSPPQLEIILLFLEFVGSSSAALLFLFQLVGASSSSFLLVGISEADILKKMQDVGQNSEPIT